MSKKINIEVTKKQTRKLNEPFVITIPSHPEVMVLLTPDELHELEIEIASARTTYNTIMEK